MITHSLPLSLPVGFWSKAYIITSEEADEGAIAIPVNRSTKASPNINTFFLSMLSPLIYRFTLPYFLTEKSDEGERGRGVIKVMNEWIQKHPAEKPTFLKEKRSMEKSSFVKGTVCFRYV